MITIPSKTKQFSQTNLSDVSGNIWYTKNINFDEQGYMKLSSRSASIACIEDYSFFGYPMSIGTYTLTGKAWIVTSDTTDHTFDVDLTSGGISIGGNSTTGGNRPVGSQNNRGAWWQNRWHVTYQTGMAYNVAGTWTDTGISITTAYPHPLEVFKSRNTLCVGNANVVKQYTTAYGASTADLTIPADYTVVALAYSSDLMGIGTQTANTLPGQNQEALFYTWDGLQTSANRGYPVGSDAIVALRPYKSSWVLLTRNGKLLYFNGGGFDTLCTLPFFFKKYTVDASSMLGDIMRVEGDLIYLNLPADISYYGLRQERYLQNFVGGILCYDPKVGLYHRYSPSISKLYNIAVSGASASTDILTASSGTLPTTGNPIMYTNDPSSLIGGLTTGTVYYIIKHTSTTFSLATTYQNAINGVKVNITSSVSGTFVGLALTDYGISKATTTNAVTIIGSQSFHYDHLMFGGYYDNVSGTPKQNLCITVPQFPNRGYAITPKLESEQVEDILQNLFTKYRPLKSIDSIIVKHKSKELVGLPISTPQRALDCTWTSSTVLTTTADISEAYTYLQTSGNECECEVISGAGAGQMPQISSISYSVPTYTITLAEAVEGVSNGNKCNILIDNWKLYKTITSSDSENWTHAPIAKSSQWHKLKIELRGVDTTIAQLIVAHKTQIPAV